jgi:ATP-binding cassette, subfamily B, bacterial MsbA
VEESFRMERTVQLITPVQNVTTLVALLVVAFSLNWVIREPGAYQTSAYLVFFFIVRRMVPGFNALNKFAVSLATASGGILPVLDILEDDKEKHIVRGGKRQFRELEQSIEFRDLHFSYYPDTPVIQGVSFSIEKGKTTAIVGPTGAGKTSLIGLILRFYDCPPGSLFLDGVDIREYDVHALRRQMALVSQDVLLFNDTLRSNMLYGYTPNGRDADEAMRQSTEKSCLSDFVAALPNHYDTMIGERGVQLSGGEKQRVSIARAILKGANILLLDEATSSLDSKTERFIQEGIDNAIRGKTAVVIAHRLSTIRHADKVIVIEGGRVVEEGPLEALLAKKGKFFEYWEAQKFY